MSASSRVEATARGRLMWQDQAVNFFESVDGGSMSRAAAEAKWKSLVADLANDPTMIHDEEGPPHSKQRIWIHTHDDVDFASICERKKLPDS